MATGDILSICNRALLELGGRALISNINEGSVQAKACNILFQPLFEQLARAAYWNCLRAQVQMNLVQSAPGTPENPQGTLTPYPPPPWLYSYLLPTNALAARYLVPTPLYGTVGSPALTTVNNTYPLLYNKRSRVFQVVAGADQNGNPLQLVVTNMRLAQLVYTINQPFPATWDSLFQQAMVSALAAKLVPALTLDKTLMGIQIKIAETAIKQARIRDGDEGTTSADHIPDWQRARTLGYSEGYNSYGAADSFFGLTDMCWGA